MKEKSNFNFFSQKEAALTKKASNPTLNSSTYFNMEGDQEGIKKATDEIKDIVRDFQRLGIDADQATASKIVSEVMLGRKLLEQEEKAIIERGLPIGPESEETNEEFKIVEEMIKNPKKFEDLINSTKSYTPDQLRHTFTGNLGKIVAVILTEGEVDWKKYVDDLNATITKKGPYMHQEIIDVIKQIEKDVSETKKKKAIEEEKRMKPEEVDLRRIKVEEAWEMYLDEKRRRGEPITPEYLKIVNEQIERGLPPIAGGAEDGIFSKMDWGKYKNEELKVLALELKELGESNQIDQNIISQKREDLRRLLDRGEITQQEYDEFRTDFEEKAREWQKEREKALEVSEDLTQQKDTSSADNIAREQISSLIDSISEDEDEATFEQKKRNVLSDDAILLLLDRYISNEEEREKLNKEWNNLQDVQNPQEFKEKAHALVYKVISTKPSGEDFESTPQTEADAKEELRKKGLNINNIYQRGIQEGWLDPDLLRTEPRSIVDLAKWIMITDDARIWGPYSEHGYPLFKIVKKGVREINPTTGEPEFDSNGRPKWIEQAEIEFQPSNLIIWLRNKMIELHLDNSSDPMSPLSQVAIRTLYGPVNLIAMKYDKQRYFSDPKTGEIMDDLYNEVIMEAWLFGVRRNNDLIYRQNMTNDEKLFETLVAINSKNEHTSSTNAAEYYSMAENYVMGYDENGNERKRDTKVGDAILLANALYRNISDIEKLKKLFPPDSPLFTREGWENAVRIIEGKGVWEKVTEYANMKFDEDRVYVIDPATKQESVIFDKNGKLNEGNFIKYLNFFVSPNPPQTNVAHVRELVKLTIAEHIGLKNGLSYPPTKEEWEAEQAKAKEEKRSISIKSVRNVMRINLEFAEINSFVEQRWNGAAARSDTGTRGYDAWTKMFVQRYRERQSKTDTMGPIGNPKDIPILKMLAPDMWLALKTENGEAAQEIFERILTLIPKLYKEAKTDEEREQLQNLRSKIMSTLRFPEGTQLDWAANQVMRAAKIFHALLGTEDLGFDKLVKRNEWGVLQYSRRDFEDTVKDTFIKNRRYAFKSNNSINFGAMTREFVGEKNNLPIYKDVTVAEYMFGHDVIVTLMEDWYSGKVKIKKRLNPMTGKLEENVDYRGASVNDYLNSSEGRNHLFKLVCRAGLAAQLKAHREWFGTGERWDNSIVRNFVESLKTLRAYKEDPPGSGREVIDTSQGYFFSQEDLDWILEQAGCQKWKMALQDAGIVGLDLSKSIPELMKLFMNGIFDLS